MEQDPKKKECECGGKGHGCCKTHLLIPALLLALALFGGLFMLGDRLYASRQIGGLTVTGSAKKTVQADLAKWTTNFTRRANLDNLADVIVKVGNDKTKITKIVTDLGIKAEGVTFLPVQTDAIYEQLPGYGYSQNIIGYNVRQEIRVESEDIEKVDRLANETGKFIDLGLVPEYQRTEYYYTKLTELRPELFAAATSDAKTRAEAIAKGSGATVGEPTSAKTGVIQILPPNSTDVADYGAYDLTTKEKEVSATVSVTFALKK
jgi:hypothetical protein